MTDFIKFKLAIQKQFASMVADNTPLFTVDPDRDVIRDKYLNSFSPEDNPIFRERTTHDCSCCKAFIRQAGGIVAIDADYNLVSIWDVTVPAPYQQVADNLASYVKAKAIQNGFLTELKKIGVDSNYDTETPSIKWEHFHLQIPPQYVVPKDQLGTTQGTISNAKKVFYRALSELSADALEIVLDLTAQGSLYKGAEYKRSIKALAAHQAVFLTLSPSAQDNYAWQHCQTNMAVSHIRNSAIGTLLIDLSEGMELEKAVSRYEVITAPTNYKRPSALVTPRMLKDAKQTIAGLGLSSALIRRFANYTDLSANNMLFVDRDTPLAIDVFDDLIQEAGKRPQKLDKVEDISMNDFIANVLPNISTLELLVENRHESNLVSLIAPTDKTAGQLFKWSNSFSWVYNGDVTDSIKQRVKTAGGNVTGFMRASLAWYNIDDLDLHCIEPGAGSHIYFSHKRSITTGGNLDVDMNANDPLKSDPVENIVHPSARKLINGIYTYNVHNYYKRKSTNVGFEVEFELDGTITNFAYDKPVPNNATIEVCKVIVKDGTYTLKPSLPTAHTSKSIWGIETERFQPVSLLLLSPNHWDEAIGNKHWFFTLKHCKNPETPRGFYNEYLTDELTPYRKAFEVVGNKLRVKATNDQLSGLGFSSTQRNSITCRVGGSFNRVLKINF